MTYNNSKSHKTRVSPSLLEDAFLEKPQRGGGQIDPTPVILGLS